MAWNDSDNNNQGRDPWSGRNQEGPPDLDEMLKRLKRKFKGGNSNHDDSGNGMSKIGIGIVAVILLVIWAVSGIFIVSPAEQSVVLRFGRYVETLGPGPHWIPRLIDRQYKINVQRVSNFSYNAQMLTKDQNIVSVALAVQYRVDEPKQYLFNVVNPIASIQQATASALRQVIGHTTLDDVLTIGREKVRQQVNEQLKHVLAIYQTGVIITDVAMQPAKAPEEVKDAFDDAIKAQEDEQRFINQAQAYEKGVIPIAEGKSKRILQEANAYKEQRILAARGDVSRFLAVLPEYRRAPTVTRERMYLDTVESVLSSTSKILVDVKGSNNMLYVPLDRIFAQAGVTNLPQVDTSTRAPAMPQNQTTKPSRPYRAPYRPGRA